MFNIQQIFQNDTFRILISFFLFVIVYVIVFFVFRLVLKKMRRWAQKTESVVDDFIIDLLRIPILWLLFWILFSIFTSASFISETKFYNTLSDINRVLLILTVGWILVKGVRVLFYYFQNKLDVSSSDNLNARKDLTRMKVFEGIIVALIVILTLSVCLMSFEEVRSVGLSLLTSAGIAGIIIGFAAQKSIATFLAGVQIAVAQPIRLDDVVIVEGEWGRIEEITLTYVVVKIWDERRLVVPVNYFIENPFQNWTKTSSNILGTVFLYTDYSIPVDVLRTQLDVMLKGHPLWDGRVANIQITDSKERYMELRILLSSVDSSLNWDLRVDIREKMIAFINREYPGSFAKMRVETVEPKTV
jgi:small-conductance mechanosensitive channel